MGIIAPSPQEPMHVNHPNEPSAAEEQTSRHRVRREALLATALIFFGVFVLPALIFWVGVRMLGPYPGGAGLGAFYGEFLRDLASMSGRAWFIALGPFVMLTAVRIALFAGSRKAQAKKRPQSPPKGQRREPRVGL